jgi:hypothetical protein
MRVQTRSLHAELMRLLRAGGVARQRRGARHAYRPAAAPFAGGARARHARRAALDVGVARLAAAARRRARRTRRRTRRRPAGGGNHRSCVRGWAPHRCRCLHPCRRQRRGHCSAVGRDCSRRGGSRLSRCRGSCEHDNVAWCGRAAAGASNRRHRAGVRSCTRCAGPARALLCHRFCRRLRQVTQLRFCSASVSRPLESQALEPSSAARAQRRPAERLPARCFEQQKLSACVRLTARPSDMPPPACSSRAQPFTRTPACGAPPQRHGPCQFWRHCPARGCHPRPET